jgi:hypothetical protein
MVLGLAACGGDDGDSSARHETTAVSSLDGVYDGDWMASDGDYGRFDTQLSHGKLYSSSADGIIMELDVKLAGNAVTATGRFYCDDDTKGTVQGSGTLSGSHITMSLDSSDGIHNNVIFTRTTTPDDKAGFDLIKGMYHNLAGTLNINFSAAGALSGALSGGDSLGCIYSGDIDIIDPSINVYALTLNMASCGDYNGDYKGFVSRDKSDGSLHAIYGNAERLLVIALLAESDYWGLFD